MCLATPTLTVSGRSSAAARQTLRCGLPIVTSSGVVTIRGGVTLAAAPALARAAAVATGFRVFPNNLSQSGRVRPLDLLRQLLVMGGGGARAGSFGPLARAPAHPIVAAGHPFGLQRLPHGKPAERDHWAPCYDFTFL